MDHNHDLPFELLIYPQANKELESIFQYISETLGNPDAADRLMDAILEALDRVCLMPALCPLIDNRYVKDPSVRKLIVKNYLVFYRPVFSKREIHVLHVAFGKSHYSSLF